MDPITEMRPQEVIALHELKQRICDVMPAFKDDFSRSDLALLRFLRARELNLDGAETMLRNHLRWREANQVDEILEAKLPLHFFEEFPVKLCGRDKDGYLVAAVPLGKWEFRSMLDSGLKDDFVRFVIQWIERGSAICAELTTKTKFYCQVCLIFDFDEFPYLQLVSKAFISLVLELIKIFEANYPEVLRMIWAINTPSVFSIFWGIIKPFISERSSSKIRIFGSNKIKWRADILTMIDEDNIPSLYSGANTSCPNYDIESKLDVKKLSPNYRTFPKEDMTEVYVSEGQLFSVDVNASYGMEINWNFCTDKYDIKFRVDFEHVRDIIESCRVDSHLCVQKGRITCEKSGLYTLVFDNTDSACTAKSLRYIVWTS